MKNSKPAILTIIALTFCSCAGASPAPQSSLADQISHSEQTPHWGYSGNGAPEQWATLSEHYTSCAGVNQSPVNLSNFVKASLPPLDLQYTTTGNEITNNGHTIQVTLDPGSHLAIDGKRFEAKQFHFHSPSENTLNGTSFPLEAHIVHANDKGAISVLAILYEEGDEDPTLASFWPFMPENPGDNQILEHPVNPLDLLPTDKAYYRFNGSLTTPPCTEGVRWFVMKDPMTVSADQVKTFQEIMKHRNNRPVQPLNARLILE